MSRYHEHQFFESRDPGIAEAHANGDSEYKGVPIWNVEDYCANCGAEFAAHHNGHCPT